MLNRLTDIFDRMDSSEIAQLLDGIEGEKPDRGLVKRMASRALPTDSAQKSRRVRLRRLPALAAAAAVICAMLICGTAYAADVREYNRAVDFFDEYDLDTEGLTRAEIKAVYRDITTGSFTDLKTVQVIGKNSFVNTVDGYAISQEVPTPEETRLMWERLQAEGRDLYNSGIHYETRHEYTDGTSELPRLEHSWLDKYDGDTLLWSAGVSQFEIHRWTEVTGGVIAYGRRNDEQSCGAALAMIDNDGNVLWTQVLFSGFKDEYIAAVLERDDGSLAVISRGDLKCVCLNLLTGGGQVTYTHSVEVGNYGVEDAAILGDGYLVRLYNALDGAYATLLRLDALGEPMGELTYGSEEENYYITGLREYNGQVYISAYATPANGSKHFNRGEIDSVLDYIFYTAEDPMEISSEELTPVLRDNYTALLMICDPDTGRVRSFYQVPGSLGGALGAGPGGELTWEVESIVSSFFSPATNAFSIGGTCTVYRYSFSPDGELISRLDTGKLTSYAR